MRGYTRRRASGRRRGSAEVKACQKGSHTEMSHTHLRREALKERTRTLCPEHFPNHIYTRNFMLKVGVLDARLHRIERCLGAAESAQRDKMGEKARHTSHSDTCDGACDRRNEVLCPRRFGVVLDSKDIILRERRCTEQLHKIPSAPPSRTQQSETHRK